MYKRYWICHYEKNGFSFPIFVYGTEDEMREYMTSELGYQLGYSGATEKEVEAGRALRMKFYIAPEIR